MDASTIDKPSLFLIDKELCDGRKPTSDDFGDDFKLKFGQSNRSKKIHGGFLLGLRDENDVTNIEIRNDLAMLEKLQNNSTHIMLNNIPESMEENPSKTVRPEGAILVETKNITPDLFIKGKTGKNIVHVGSN